MSIILVIIEISDCIFRHLVTFMAIARTYSKTTLEAVKLLGRLIRLGRQERHWTKVELTERAGISRATLDKIEKGDPGSSLGLAFEVATLVGVKLFDADRDDLRRALKAADERIALLPQRTHPQQRTVEDDF